MPQRFSTALRVLAVLLLALAVSPLTAPFSTTSPSQLLGTTGPDDGPLVGARKAPDEPIAGLTGRPPGLVAVRVAAAPPRSIAAGAPRGLDSLHLQLRV